MFVTFSTNQRKSFPDYMRRVWMK